MFFSFRPELVTLDEVGEIGDLQVATVLNGEVRRKIVVSNMTYGPWQLVLFHPEVMTLLPGVIRSYNAPKVRFSVTVGQEPEVELALA
jgi:2-keto-4-pentenoate hydratase/2-oxohepta-3-ene-1,7-dioic acid hydratase in catechol pathway